LVVGNDLHLRRASETEGSKRSRANRRAVQASSDKATALPPANHKRAQCPTMLNHALQEAYLAVAHDAHAGEGGAQVDTDRGFFLVVGHGCVWL